MKNTTTIGKTLVGSLQNEQNRKYAAKLLSEGKLVALFNRGVNAIWLDADSSIALQTIPKIKGLQRIGKPLSLTIGFEHLLEMVDHSKISSHAQALFQTTDQLKKLLGSLCFLRFPIQKKFVPSLPKSVVSFDKDGVPWIQNWDGHGHTETEDVINEARKLGVKYAAVTSMNLSGEPEVVDQDEAAEFCQKHEIPMYLKDPVVYPNVKGSYTIFTLTQDSIELTRDGNIPGKVISKILGKEVAAGEHTKLPKHSQMEFPEVLYQGLTPEKIRLAILMYIKGIDPLEINKKLRQTK